MRSLSLSLFLLPLLGWSQPPKALLWKISGQGLSRPSYIVGTIHSRDARAFGQVPQLLEIIKGQDAVAGELDLTSAFGASLDLAMAMMMPEGKELEDLYSKPKYKRVQEAVQQELGPMAMMAGRIKPFFLMAMLSETAMREDSAMVLDQYLEQKAKAMGKDVLGIETAEEQMAAVNDLPLQEQADMLYELVEHDLYRADMERMMDAYAAQDLDRLTKIATLGGLSDKFSARLLTDRNKVMTQRVDSLMQGGRTFLFAVGAAHLPQEQGLLEQLRRMGYAVEPVLKQAIPRP
ncbi:MAG: TraB/GumN family protein [Flavobacteriales bacterium]